MPTRILILLAVNITWVLSGWAEEKGNQGVDKLEGTWKIEQGEAQGQTVPEAKIKGTLVVITKDTIRVEDDAHKQTWVVNYKLASSKNSQAIDLTLQEGQFKGQTAEGIYQLDGENLKLCYSLAEKQRPTEFTAKEGSHQMLFVMKRVKSKEGN